MFPYLRNKCQNQNGRESILNEALHSHIEAMRRADMAEKSSLKYVNPNSLKVGQTHHVWPTVSNYLTDSKRA